VTKRIQKLLTFLFIGCLLTVSFSSSPHTASANNPTFVPNNQFISAVIELGGDTLDPALAYNSASNHVISQIYETLITYNRERTDEFIPQLATSWEISAEGDVYTFYIRPGVTFHGGQSLTAEDVAYTFQRGILQGGYASPQWLITEPFLGRGIDDITGIVDGFASADDRDLLKTNPPEVLLAACETVKSKIVADEGAGTVTMHLAQPWSPFLVTLAGSWGSILDEDWVAAQGGWDGSCETWQNYYAMTSAEDPLSMVTNGTGPFSLSNWTPDVEIRLAKNTSYWRTTPMWTDGPSGTAFFDEVIINQVDLVADRLAMLTGGSVDYAQISVIYQQELDAVTRIRYNADGSFKSMGVEDGILAAYDDRTGISADVSLMNFLVAADSPFIGTGTWETGIPVDFFSDIHIRKAFNYAFDWDEFIQQAYAGKAIQTYGPIIKGVVGYRDDQPHFTYNLTKAAEELALAFDGEAAANGFSFGCAYNEGNNPRRLLCELLKAGFESLDPKYNIDVIPLPWADYLTFSRNYKLPIQIGGWMQDIPHPHNWVVPYLTGTYASRQHFPQAIKDKFKAKIDACLVLVDDAAVRACYEDIQVNTHQDALAIYMMQTLSNLYLNDTVNGYYYNPALSGLFYYALSKDPVVMPDESLPVTIVDDQENQVDFTIPAGTVSENVQLIILPDISGHPLDGGLYSSSVGFDIQGYLESDGSPVEMTFDPPLQMTITYTNLPIIENTLMLYYWNGTGWEDAACGAYVRDPDLNTITVPVCHLSQFQLGGETLRNYLPTITR
jgi:peptide/nickel transport system substrate-binding protein